VIRLAQPADVSSVLELIRQLARYENEPDAVQTDETALRAALFGAHPLVHAHVAEQDGVVVGAAIWFVNFSTWTGRHGIYLEDLIVDGDHRRAGHGRQLIAELARICVERAYERLEWSVLDWNEPALRFYRSIGAHALSDWTVHRVDGAELGQLGSPRTG
jgi:GNAT superfamily N-acetyltransferase